MSELAACDLTGRLAPGVRGPAEPECNPVPWGPLPQQRLLSDARLPPIGPSHCDRARPELAAGSRRQVVALCSQNFSVRGTRARLDASCEHAPSEPTIDRILEEVGFTHLPRHTCAKLWGDSLVPIEARCSIRLAPSHSE